MNKWYNFKEIEQKIATWRLKSNTIVFTNGCFDILHAGHIHLLEKAKQEGHKLIVGLNSDDSVKRLKGPSRPINSTVDRATVLAALSVVDAVVVFEDDTPLELIKRCAPDVLVKGGDYTEDSIVGAAEVKAHGGSVSIIPFLEGHSSTSIINKLAK